MNKDEYERINLGTNEWKNEKKKKNERKEEHVNAS